jgi:transcriptional regulator with XRE-family HTH domain
MAQMVRMRKTWYDRHLMSRPGMFRLVALGAALPWSDFSTEELCIADSTRGSETRKPMIRFDDVGNRVRAFRLGSGLSADEIAKRMGISRTALYRLERGEFARVEFISKAAELLDVSLATLLGVGVEYIASAVSYFERVRQFEQTADQVIFLAGPLPYLLSSAEFDAQLTDVLIESIPEGASDEERVRERIHDLTAILHSRKESYRRRPFNLVNLISAYEIENFLRNGLVGRFDLPENTQKNRRAVAQAEMTHFAGIVEEEQIGVQIGIVQGTLPHTGFQIFRQPDRHVLLTSPFRLGEQPNVRVGVAMVTSAPEALALHQKAADEMWKRALKGKEAAQFLRTVLAKYC